MMMLMWKQFSFDITAVSDIFPESLAYMKPRIGENRFGGESVTYEGVGGTKKWERIESYGPKFVENIVQAIEWILDEPVRDDIYEYIVSI